MIMMIVMIVQITPPYFTWWINSLGAFTTSQIMSQYSKGIQELGNGITFVFIESAAFIARRCSFRKA